MIGIVDAGGTNIASIRNAILRLEQDCLLVSDPKEVKNFSHLILPGVGHAASAMERIRSLELEPAIRSFRGPILGICLGLQLFFDSSEEGSVECLGFFKERVAKLPSKPGLRVPNIGWQALNVRSHSALLKGVPRGSFFYFVHSYAAPITDFCIASVEDRAPGFAAIVESGNLYGTQFHPERSGNVGMQLLKNFVELPSEQT